MGGRSLKCPEIGYELFQWFVDTIRLVKARVGSDVLMAKAKQVLHDAEVSVQELLAVGRITEDQVPSWPTIGKQWVTDWRKRWRVSYRAKTIVCKVPRARLASVLEERHHSEVFPFQDVSK